MMSISVSATMLLLVLLVLLLLLYYTYLYHTYYCITVLSLQHSCSQWLTGPDLVVEVEAPLPSTRCPTAAAVPPPPHHPTPSPTDSTGGRLQRYCYYCTHFNSLLYCGVILH